MDHEADRTKGELLKLAATLGISERQFDRWRNAGLLPVPIEVRKLGHAIGSEAVYPSITARQLRRLREFHFGSKTVKPERRLLFLGWKLWWDSDDWQVSRARIREFLVKHVTSEVDHQAALLRAATPEMRQRAIDELATKPLGREPGPLAKVRQHLRGDTAEFLALVAAGLDGELPDDAETLGLIEKAAGTARARTDNLLGQPLVADNVNPIPAIQASLTKLQVSLTAEVEEMTDEELLKARSVSRRLSESVAEFARFGRDAKGKGGLGLGDFVYPPGTPRGQGERLVVFHLIAKVAAATGLVSDPAELPGILEQLLGPYRLVQVARQVKPYDELMSTRSVLDAAASSSAEAEHLRDIRRVARDDPEAARAARKLVEQAERQPREEQTEKH